MDRNAMRPPLRQHVQFAADGEVHLKPLQGLIEQRSLAPIQSQKKQGHGREEGVGQRCVETVKEEVSAAIDRIGGTLDLIEMALDGRSDPGIATFACSAIVEHAGAKGCEVPPHQLCEDAFDRREILVGFNDRKQGVGTCGEVRQMVAGCCHHEMEVPIDLLAVALCDDRLERGCGLFKGDARLNSVTAEFAETQSQSEKRVAVGMQIVAELRRKGRGIGRKRAVAPDDCARLAAGYETSPKSGCRRFCDVGDDSFRRCWHWQSLGRKPHR